MVAARLIVLNVVLPLVSCSGAKSCVKKVLTGMDNMLGVCEANEEISNCVKEGAQSCKKVKGPGGNLITQDISEDVQLGAGTKLAAEDWHAVFTKCANEMDSTACAQATKLYKPVLTSVQNGLTKLLATDDCQSNSAFPKLSLAKTDFTDCDAAKGTPAVRPSLVAISKRLREIMPETALAKFPLHGVVHAFEPHFKLPEEAEDP
eukprot:TRINITY_DN48164_c0_g1_i1.p2 TRINITY_DN48164_c0_g1~~TRINITY_DN48164_c0_g1_i1.p2  ORF type:complete len:205 (-),score=45.01 TRINITY_DN48164_c0_g1_i1:78-692(-)